MTPSGSGADAAPLTMARQGRNPYMQTDMSYTSTEDLVRSYTLANEELSKAAARVWTRAIEDIEMSFVECLTHWSFDTLRKAVKGEDEDVLGNTLWSVCDTSPWVIIPHRARAVRKGAIAMEEYAAFDGAVGKTLEEKVAGTLYTYVRPKVQMIAQAALERRILWAMENR